MFLTHGLPPIVRLKGVRIVFSLISPDMNHFDKLQHLQYKHKKVHIINYKTTPSINYLWLHSRVINMYVEYERHFIFLSCDARGPYHYDPSGKTKWIDRFLGKLRHGTRAVGATVSCEVSPHVQSYAMAVDKRAARVLMRTWGEQVESNMTRFDDVLQREVAGSAALLENGYNIGALHTRYAGVDFRNEVGRCASYGKGGNWNPVGCYYGAEIACAGVEPCEVMFVLLGGQLWMAGWIPDPTSRDSGYRELDKESPICSYVPPLRPDWNAMEVWYSIHNHGLNPTNFQRDKETEMVVIIRSHIGFGYKLISMLASMKAIAGVRLRALIVCTESDSCPALRALLTTHKFIDDSDQASWSSVWSGLRISLLDIPESVFTIYGPYLKSICTEPAMRLGNLSTNSNATRRSCTVNSPLHYLLVDAVLSYVKEYCMSCRMVVVTNADNTYSSSFFTEVMALSTAYDLVLTNTLNRGQVLEVRSKRCHVDLGSFATSVRFLRETGITFMTSLPLRPLPQDYHDLDGLFVENLQYNFARISTIKSILFSHN